MRSFPVWLTLGGLALLPGGLEAEAPAASKRSSLNAIYAQSLVNEVMLGHPEVLLIGLHAVPTGAKAEVIIAASVDKIGEPDSVGDSLVHASGSTILENHLKWGFTYGSVLTPITDATGKVVAGAAIGFLYTGQSGDWEHFLRAADEIKSELARKIPDASSLLQHVDTVTPLLVEDHALNLAKVKGDGGLLSIDEPARRLLVPHPDGDVADILDLDKGTVIGQVKIKGVRQLAVDAKKKRYFAGLTANPRIEVIDAQTLDKVGTVKLERPADAIVFDQKRRRLWVVAAGRLSAIDPESLSIGETVEIPPCTPGLVYDSATERLYMNLQSTDEVLVVNASTMKIEAHWSSLPATGLRGLALDSSRGLLFSAGSNGRLVKITVADGKVVRAVAIVEQVDQIAFDPSSRRIYCAGPDDMTIAQDMKAGGLRLIGSVKTASRARTVAVDPKTHAVWTSYNEADEAHLKSWQLP